MTAQEYHQTKLIEELSEVTKEICKAQRFGLYETNPTTGMTNDEAIQQELFDVIYIAERLAYSTNMSSYDFSVRHEKYQKWFKYSQDKGLINEAR